MLDELHVKNVALIRDASFAPAAGLTVITGETGAGKTALLSALKLLSGERADAATVREGASAAVVEGRFFFPDDAAEHPDGHVAVRKVTSDGRSRVTLDGSMATVGQLAGEVGSTIDLCGQHEHQHLLKPANHVKMLDAWAGDAVIQARTAYGEAFRAAQAAQAELDRIREASRSSAAQVQEARFVLQRIDEANPTLDEYDDLMRELPRIENAEALARATDVAYHELSADGGAIDATNAAIRELAGMAKADAALEPLAQSLTDASFILEDVARDVRAYRDAIEHDPEALAALQERASMLQGLMRSYGPRMEDVIERREQAARLVASVDDSEALIAAAEKALDQAESQLAQCAKALDDARGQAAPRFAEAVGAHMARLEMGGAQLVCSIEPLERAHWTPAGPSKMEFLYRASAGMTPRPLARIASGGEISRVMLACKVVLGQNDERDTLVFDEVDAGVGGSVAVALADVLATLALTHQVIVVTHLPQVAVRGSVHYLVKKEGALGAAQAAQPQEDGARDGAAERGTHAGAKAQAATPNEAAPKSEKAALDQDGLPETTLVKLGGEDRVLEIARMLSGSTDEAACAHAREMLEKAEL